MTRQKGNTMSQELDTTAANAISVTVVQAPSNVKSVTLQSGDTVADAIRAAGFSSDGQEVRVDGERVNLDDTIEPGERVILTKRIKGSR